MADELGAVRRTPRPTGDRQTPETAPQESAGTTNTASPVSGDQLAISSRVSSQVESGDLSPEAAAILVEQHGPEIEALAKLGAHILDTTSDLQAYAELPECTACDGSGKDDHGTVFEAPLAVHFAGPYVTIGGRRRQLCAWCGHVLLDVQLAPGQEHEPWFDVKLVRVEDGTTTRQPYAYGDPLPPGCCALLDDEDQAPTEPAAAPPPSPWLRCPNTPPCEHPSLIHDVSGDPEDPMPMCCADGCRCGQPAADGPDEAQETRAAADWPAEEADRG